MTKSLRATFEKLHPRSGRFYDAETNRYFALSKQAGDFGKRVDSDSQQFWEFLQLACGALQGELDEARAQVAALYAALKFRSIADLGRTCKDGGWCHHQCQKVCARQHELSCVPLSGSGLDDNWEIIDAKSIAAAAKARDKAIWDEGWVAGRDAAANLCGGDTLIVDCVDQFNNYITEHKEGVCDGVGRCEAAIRALTPTTDKNGSGE